MIVIGILAITLLPLLVFGLGDLFSSGFNTNGNEDSNDLDEDAPPNLTDGGSILDQFLDQALDDGATSDSPLSIDSTATEGIIFPEGENSDHYNSDHVYENGSVEFVELSENQDSVEFSEASGNGKGALFDVYGVPKVQSLGAVLTVDAKEGDDSVSVDGRAAIVRGGPGNDSLELVGASGMLLGGDGGDLLVGDEDRASALIGGNDDDVLNGGSGNDFLFGDAIGDASEVGNDVLVGGNGDDVLEGGLGADDLNGGDGDDELWAGSRFARNGVLASDGSQYISDGFGDSLDGGAGNDLLVFERGDTASGGQGSDLFLVFGSEDDLNEPAIISDFDAQEDAIEIYLDTENFERFGDEMTIENRDNGTVISVGHYEVLLLMGVSEIDTENITILRAPE